MREIGEMRAEDGREGPVSMTVGGLCEEWLGAGEAGQLARSGCGR